MSISTFYRFPSFVCISENAYLRLSSLLKELVLNKSVVIVTDDNVWNIYSEKVFSYLKDEKRSVDIYFCEEATVFASQQLIRFCNINQIRIIKKL